MSQSLATNRRIWLVLTTAASAFLFTAYFEYVSLLVVCGGACDRGRIRDRSHALAPIGRRGHGCSRSAFATGVFLHVDLLRHPVGQLAGLPGFQQFFPWACTGPEGAARLLVGDLVLRASPSLVLTMGGVAIARPAPGWSLFAQEAFAPPWRAAWRRRRRCPSAWPWCPARTRTRSTSCCSRSGL